jgi:PAS domain S-box-containing protein
MARMVGYAGLVLLLLMPVAMAVPAASRLEPVTLQLKWKPQFQFAGYYAALGKGFFREEGLDVTLQPGGPDIAPLREVMEGRAQYGIDAGELVYYRLQGQPVVALASIFQHSPAVLMTLGSSALRTPHDLAHKRVGILVGGQPIVEVAAMFVNEGVKLDALALEPNAVGMDALLSGKLDADFGYMTNEPFQNQQAGGRDVNYLLPVNYGVDFYGDTLFTTERQLQEHPQQVAALRRAVVRGWQYALNNPDEIVRFLLDHYSGLDRDALHFEAERIRELVKPDIVEIGHMNPERWRRMADTFVKLGMVQDTSHLEGFLYDPDGKPDLRWLWWAAAILGGVVLLGFLFSALLAWFNGRLREKNTLLEEAIQSQQQTDDLLRESQRSLKSLIGNLPGMAYRCHYDRRWTTVFASDGCEMLTGYPSGYFTGTDGFSFNALIHPDDRERVWEEVAEASKAHDDGAFQLTYRLRHKDGHWLWVWEQGHCVARDGQGDPLYLEGLIMDISSQVDARQKLQQAKEQADAATRAKSIFLANISHEIRTPLAAVTGLAELLQKDTLTGKQREYAEKLHDSSRLLLGIVEDVMDFSRIEAGEVVLRPAPFALRGILTSVEHIVRQQVEAKGLSFRIQVQADVPQVLVGDPLRLSQVLNNLLLNAVKFTHKGEVSLHVSVAAQQADAVRLLFCVRDTGIGISADQREHLFEPFIRIEAEGDAAIHGTGLGLSISRHLVGLMGGAIRVESIPGVGSEFSFQASFGIVHETSVLDAEETPPDASILTGTLILLVDDDLMNLMIGTEILQTFGCEVLRAENAQQALAVLEEKTPALMLLDIEMPGMKGDELARHLRQDTRWDKLPIIALTAHACGNIREQCLDSGMDDYLAKPFDVAHLQALLLRWLKKSGITAPR